MSSELFPPVLSGAPILTAAELLLPVLSIRQPWAWLVAAGHKNLENRTWVTHYRGRFLIHASKGCTTLEHQEAVKFVMAAVPSVELLVTADQSTDRGGIIGIATLTNCVRASESPWFSGPVGFVIADAERRQFHPCPGSLGFFRLPRL